MGKESFLLCAGVGRTCSNPREVDTDIFFKCKHGVFMGLSPILTIL